MKSSQGFILASVIAGIGLACGVYLSQQKDPLPAREVNPRTGQRVIGNQDRSSASLGNHSLSERPKRLPLTNQGARELSEIRPSTEARKILGGPVHGGQALTSEAQWMAHAAKVEIEANHELDRLAALLDLEPKQQTQLFGLLARQSAHWLPGMQTGGESNSKSTVGTTEAGDLMAYLNSDQQQTLVQDEMDRQAWWEEVLPQLLPPQFQEGTTSPAVTESAPDSKAFDDGDVPLEE
jgi:hypothetical protein